MSNRTLDLTDNLYQYVLDTSLREAPVLSQLREETAQLPMARMQIAPEQGQFMALLAKLTGARRVIEVGVFTGYSSLAVALALPKGGQLIGCDISEEYTDIARRYWLQAGVNDKIDLRLAPAQDTLQALLDQNEAGQFDFAFIDADKENYLQYYELCLQLLRVGGVMLIDNVLWSGSVIDSDKQDCDTLAIRAFNQHLKNDQRVEISLLPIADGLTIAMKTGD